MGDIKIKEAKNIEKLRIGEVSHIDPLVIKEVQAIAPAAVHIKELNHIDPLSIESLRVSEVRNLDPIRVEQFNVTNLPTVNLSIRQLPAADLNIRRLPPVSIGFHQDLCLPSTYTVRAKVLGVEVFRVHLEGHTAVKPRAQFRREQARVPSQSFPDVAVAGNPGIPSTLKQASAHVRSTCVHPLSLGSVHRHTAHGPGHAPRLHAGSPAQRFSMTNSQSVSRNDGSSISSGEV
ncbi:MAG: hypothetical protein JSR62_17290 [Nitrospira sp.]|nr:hypothetical protein [Nitrospira sp.]